MAAVVVLGLGTGVWQYRINLARQAQLDRGQVNLLAELATSQRLTGNLRRRAAACGPCCTDRVRLERWRRHRLAAAISRSQPLSGNRTCGFRSPGIEHFLTSAAFSPDGTRIVTASEDNTARVWDAATGKEIAVLRGHARSLRSAAFSPDGSRIVTASADQTARIWDAATGKEIAVLRGHTFSVESAAFSPDGSRIVTASADKTARIWDAATGKEIAILREARLAATAVARFRRLQPRRRRASSRRRMDETARIWDAATAKRDRGPARPRELCAHPPPSAPTARASSRRQGTGRTARIWDAATGKEIAVLRGHDGRVNSAAFSPDGVAHRHGVRRTRPPASGTPRPAKEIAVLRGHEDLVRSAAFSPDGSRIVTASEDRTARIWDAATGKEIAVLRGHEDDREFRRLQPRRVAHRHGVSGQDRPHLGRRDRQARSRSCAAMTAS